MKKISWKSINSWIMFGLLLAPGAYIFGTHLTTLAGAHGEKILATDSPQGWVTSQNFSEGVKSRFTLTEQQYIDYMSVQDYTETYYLENVPEFTAHYKTNLENTLDVKVTTFRFQYNTSGARWIILRNGTTGTYPAANGYGRVDNEGNISGGNQAYWPTTWTWETGMPYYIYTKFKDYFTYQIYYEEAESYGQALEGNFFLKNNFLRKWGDSVVSQDETWGFAPFKALIQYLDENMLHFESNGVQYGLMAYGYMYYALHIVLLDLVFYITSFLPRILKKLAERLEGGLD